MVMPCRSSFHTRRVWKVQAVLPAASRYIFAFMGFKIEGSGVRGTRWGPGTSPSRGPGG